MNSNLIKLALDLKKFNNNFKNNKHRLISLNNVYNSRFLYFNHFLANEKFADSPYRNILINTFKKSESLTPGSSFDIADQLSSKILGNYKDTLEFKTERNSDSIFDYLKSLTDSTSFKIFKEIIEFSGPDATITCQATKNNEILVEKTCQPVFKIRLLEEFIPVYFSSVKKTTKNVILSVIDGYIERESELIPLIEKSKNDKLPVVLICRGISQDAVRNLKNILVRNKIVFYTYISKFNDKDPFLFDDISKTGKTKTISADTLDSIYKDTVKYCSEIKMTLSPNNVIFHETPDDIIKDINDSIKDAKDKNNSVVMEYLQKRKRRVMPNNVVANFPMDSIRIMNETKSLIRCYNVAVIGGVYINNDSVGSVYTKNNIKRLSESLFQSISKIGYTIKLGKKDEQ